MLDVTQHKQPLNKHDSADLRNDRWHEKAVNLCFFFFCLLFLYVQVVLSQHDTRRNT